MNKFILSGLVLISATAGATETRTNALGNNLGMADDTDYQMFANTTGDAGDSVTLDVNGEVLTGAMMFGANALTIGEGQFGSHLGWHHSSGDSGYSVGLDMGSTESFALDGSYSMARGDSNMAIGGALSMNGDDMGINAGVMSRELSDSDVTAWGAGVSMDGGNIDAGGMYAMGWVMGGDASNAALTVGPAINVAMPDGGDMRIDMSLVAANLAGEFMFNDWIGIRGGVVGALNLADATGDLGVSTDMGATLGGTFHSDAGDLDVMYAPAQLLGGPHFITGAGTGAALSLSARFAI
jgi:hypothetical protein